MDMLSLRYPENKQLMAWSRLLNADPNDPGYVTLSDALSMTTTLMTMVKQYSEVRKQVICLNVVYIYKVCFFIDVGETVVFYLLIHEVFSFHLDSLNAVDNISVVSVQLSTSGSYHNRLTATVLV